MAYPTFSLNDQGLSSYLLRSRKCIRIYGKNIGNHASALYFRQLTFPLAQDDLATLRDMRTASGTFYERIPIWIEELSLGRRLMWLVHFQPERPMLPEANDMHLDDDLLASLSYNMNISSPNPSNTTYPVIPSPYTAIGMVCLLLDNPVDPTLASPLTRRAEVTSLFIYAAYRHLGVGTAIMFEMENQAAALGAQFLTFNTTVASLRHLQIFTNLGYREYKPRENQYSYSDVQNAAYTGSPVDSKSNVAAFFEKALYTHTGTVDTFMDNSQ